ncbi:MAG: alpha-keto acid decarboxylase family protein [Methylobacter sp.]
MTATVIQHVLRRLGDLGITDIFGVPGDFAFPINDAICNDKNIRWIGCCNELNAAYAADGYARIKGFGALCTTYGVGELSAICGIAGAYAENLPVFHLVGMPGLATMESRGKVHHTLGNGEFDLFYKMTEPVACARAIMTPENCASETERLIAAARYHRQPVYMAFPLDYANMQVLGKADPIPTPPSDTASLEAAVNAMVAMLSKAKTAIIMPGKITSRLGLQDQVAELINSSGLPYATIASDKTAVDETHPNFIGIWSGRFGIPDEAQTFVEGADCILGLGAYMTDLFFGKIDRSKTMNIELHSVRVGHSVFRSVQMADALAELTRRLPKRTDVNGPKPMGLGEPEGSDNDPITAQALYPRWEKFLKPNDILIQETGSSTFPMISARMPKDSVIYNQLLWAAIGWATPAAFGAAIANPKRRLVLITGEGSHQMTVQEVGQFGRYGLKPIIFVLNNNGYLIERVLCENPEIEYNDLAQWNYHQLPAALGCNSWYTARVTTCGELDAAIARAESSRTGAYIEVVTKKYDSHPTMKHIHEVVAGNVRIDWEA